MSLVHPSSATRSTTNRSAVSNGSRLLEGVDGRSALGRRYRDLSMSLADDLGGADKLSTVQAAMVRQLAGVMVESERMQAAIVRDEQIDREQLVRLSNLQARLIHKLGLGKSKPAEDAPPTLHDYLSKRGAA